MICLPLSFSKKRLNSGLQKYRALDHSTGPKLLPGNLTCPLVTTVYSPLTGAKDFNTNNKVNNMWISSLLSRLQVEVCREREVSRVLQKLSGLVGEESARVRPHHLVKVLEGLKPWQLCLPDLCVAIEIVRENVVQMPREEYDAWLCSRVNLPSVPAFLHRQQMTSPSPLSQPSFVVGEGIREDSRQTNRTTHMLMRNLVKGDDSDRDKS
ncbi:unnamed protein product [Arctogadus glacialis]